MQIAAGKTEARRRGELEGIESRVDRERNRRSVFHPPATALEQLRARAGRFVLLRGARLIHGIPRCGRRRCFVDYCCCRAVFTSAP